MSSPVSPLTNDKVSRALVGTFGSTVDDCSLADAESGIRDFKMGMPQWRPIFQSRWPGVKTAAFFSNTIAGIPAYERLN